MRKKQIIFLKKTPMTNHLEFVEFRTNERYGAIAGLVYAWRKQDLSQESFVAKLGVSSIVNAAASIIGAVCGALLVVSWPYSAIPVLGTIASLVNV
jgi:hypothetical protein